MLNENIIEGKWSMVKGQIRKAWGELTDDEVEQTKGNISKITGLVQQRYGENQESIRRRINSFLADLGDTEVGKGLKPEKN
jgi:uncharacterized protein YjbJ (UPF0337 family)